MTPANSMKPSHAVTVDYADAAAIRMRIIELYPISVYVAGTPGNTKETNRTIRNCKLSRQCILLSQYPKSEYHHSQQQERSGKDMRQDSLELSMITRRGIFYSGMPRCPSSPMDLGTVGHSASHGSTRCDLRERWIVIC